MFASRYRYLDVTDAFAPWRQFIEKLDQETPEAVLTSRLQVLIESGRIKADGSRRRLREYAVRLA